MPTPLTAPKDAAGGHDVDAAGADDAEYDAPELRAGSVEESLAIEEELQSSGLSTDTDLAPRYAEMKLVDLRALIRNRLDPVTGKPMKLGGNKPDLVGRLESADRVEANLRAAAVAAAARAEAEENEALAAQARRDAILDPLRAQLQAAEEKCAKLQDPILKNIAESKVREADRLLNQAMSRLSDEQWQAEGGVEKETKYWSEYMDAGIRLPKPSPEE